MGILASPGSAANGYGTDENPTRRQKVAAKGGECDLGGEKSRRNPGPAESRNRRWVDGGVASVWHCHGRGQGEVDQPERASWGHGE